ncbi:MAG: hypothetical protein KDC66_01785 [Phaeodactylibacter sp.]|nr:hypothetical protein [Phaeodactylibacter sp.]MCB9275664.1 hypothetical protein [Lewinellaceae bacterium]
MRSRITFLMACTLLLLAAILTAPLQAQDDKSMLAQLEEEEQEALEALVLYPEETRRAILEASLYPEALIKMERLQAQSRNTFEEMLESYPRSTQEVIWDVTRYPDLVRRLVAEGGGISGRIDGILEDYPEAVRDNARRAGADYYELLAEIDKLQASANRAFAGILEGYPPVAQDALRQLLDLPEVLSLLTEHISLAILVGDEYRRDPEWVIHKADSLSLEVARAQARELEDWKAELENDPQAVNELKASAEGFAEEYGYDDEYYAYPEDDIDYGRPARDVVEYHYYYHYPYWFGYPYWYAYPRWRPYPYWYDWGFYYGPGRTVVIVQLPSFYFTHWYFYRPQHHYYYPHLSARFVRHYYGYRHSGSSICATVNNWHSNNRGIITQEWLSNDRGLEQNFREFGSFEQARERYNREHPGRALAQREFLEQHTQRYPTLAEANRNRPAAEREGYREPAPEKKDTPPVYEPDIRPREVPGEKAEPQPSAEPRPRTEPQKREEPRPPVTRPQKETEPQREKAAPQPKTEPRQAPQVEKGREYHKNTWENPKTEPRPSVEKQQAPARRETPTKTQPQQPEPRKQDTNKKEKNRGGNG